jgi:hypothetical protein
MYISGNISEFEALVKREFLFDYEEGQNEFEKCWVFGITSMENRCLMFNIKLENGAIWDRIPVHALVFDKKAPNYSLEIIQPYNCSSYNFTVLSYKFLENKTVNILSPIKNLIGKYLFTIDYAESGQSESIEHTQTHLIRTNDGLLLAQPNNRILWGKKFDLNLPHYKTTWDNAQWSTKK